MKPTVPHLPVTWKPLPSFQVARTPVKPVAPMPAKDQPSPPLAAASQESSMESAKANAAPPLFSERQPPNLLASRETCETSQPPGKPSAVESVCTA